MRGRGWRIGVAGALALWAGLAAVAEPTWEVVSEYVVSDFAGPQTGPVLFVTYTVTNTTPSGGASDELTFMTLSFGRAHRLRGPDYIVLPSGWSAVVGETATQITLGSNVIAAGETNTFQALFITDDAVQGLLSGVSNANGPMTPDTLVWGGAIPACPGDIDGDDDTDVFDFAVFAGAFGSALFDPDPNPDFNFKADLDQNDVVDVFDFAIFAADFGCPGP